ncbi:UPF0345 protein YaiE [Striga asiatica]|uniref:UPF0345 protein YaiE n=1 Tax=Striga asiatica TaxID=4170 RepID=A0A5A7QSQ1_STRAF|nr:UPF0345 protein YaiE [Striga asiatica]
MHEEANVHDGECSVSAREKRSRKRKKIVEEDNQFVGMLSSFCKETAKNISDMVVRVGHAHDATKRRGKVYEVLKGMPNLTMEEKLLTTKYLCNKTEELDMFFSLENRLKFHFEAFNTFTYTRGVWVYPDDGTITVNTTYWNNLETPFQKFFRLFGFKCYKECVDLFVNREAADVNFDDGPGDMLEDPIEFTDSDEEPEDHDDHGIVPGATNVHPIDVENYEVQNVPGHRRYHPIYVEDYERENEPGRRRSYPIDVEDEEVHEMDMEADSGID